MLHSVGLLPKDNNEQVHNTEPTIFSNVAPKVTFAYNIYKNEGDLRRTFNQDCCCKSVDIKMLGVW